MSRKYVILMAFVLFFVGCTYDEQDSQEEKQYVEKKVEIPQMKKDNSANKETDILEQLGFDIQGEKIIIDMNKTSHFFEMLEVQMNNKAKEIEKKIEQADINMSEGIGVIVEGDTIGIDLNKTRNMMQQINILMKDIFLDINSTKH